MAEIEFVDQTLRDGPQSLWGFKLYAGQVTAVGDYIDKAGFRVVEVLGSTTERLLREDRWEHIDWLRRCLPTARLRRAQIVLSSGTMGFTPDSVVDLVVQTMVKHGIDDFLLLDCMYNMDAMQRLYRVAADAGAFVTSMFIWDDSPFLPDQYFADRIRECASWGMVDSFMIEDTSGIMMPERSRTFLRSVVDAAGPIPVEFHSHNNTGIAPLNYVEAINQGVRILHTASRPMANGWSVPSVEGTVENLGWLGHTPVIDSSVLEPIATHFNRVARQEGHPVFEVVEWSPASYQHHLPGGMTGALVRQLGEHKMEDRLAEVLREIPRVRLELGSPISATPFSQFMGVQAVLNVVTGDRYSVIPDEIVMLVAGHYGQTPGPIDEDIRDRVLSTPRAKEIVDWERPQPTLAEVRRQYGMDCSDEELLTRYMVSPADLEATRAAGPLKRTYEFLDDMTVAGLINEILPRTRVRHVHYSDGRVSLTLGRNGSHSH